MKIAYLYLVHRNPGMMKRVIERLSCDQCVFFIHVDAKSNLEEFASLRGENVRLLENRTAVYWGEFSGVEATLSLIRQALTTPEDYGYFALISGSDYPLRGREYIHQFLEVHRGTEFINVVKMPSAEAGKPISRIDTVRIQSTRPVARLISKAAARMGLGRRDHGKYLGQLEPYAGHTWWTLTREACRHISDFDRQNPQVAQFFKDTFAPDEMFFQTILGNSPFRSRIRRNLCFEDWSAAGSHPADIDERHLARFEACDAVSMEDVYGRGEVLFARKFKDGTPDLLEKLDDLIAQKDRRWALARPAVEATQA